MCHSIVGGGFYIELMSIGMCVQVFQAVSRFYLVLKVHKSYLGCGARIFIVSSNDTSNLTFLSLGS